MDWELFFSIFLKEREVFFEYVGVIDPAIFKSTILQNLFVLIRKYFDKYKKIPDFDMLVVLLDKLPQSEVENKSEYIQAITKIQKFEYRLDVDVYKEQLQQQVQKYEMEKFILASANKINDINVDDMLNDLRKIVVRQKPRSFGFDVSQVDRGIKLIKHSVEEKVTSGISSLDKVLYGGYGTNEITIVMAPPGRGKSFYLLNAMYGAMLAQYNTLYVTLELSEKAVVKRLYGRIGYSSRKEMLDEPALARFVGKYFSLSKATGRVVYYPSRSLSVEGVENLLEQYHTYFGFSPQLIIVDYLDLLAPRGSDYKLDPRHKLRAITDDLRSISLRRNIPVVTATQANRASLSKVKVTEANVSESFGKVEVADVIIAICQTDEERKMKRARLVVLKNRDYVSGACIEVYIDLDRMLLLDLEIAEKMGLLEVKDAEPNKE